MSDAIERLLENVRSDVAARVMKRLEPVRRVEEALMAYRRAVEGQVATDYARDHSIPSPRLAGDPTATAAALLSAVSALPDLVAIGQREATGSSDGSAPEGTPRGDVDTWRDGDASSQGGGAAAGRVRSSSATPASGAQPSAPTGKGQLPVEWGPLVRCVQLLPLVLVGGVVRRDRLAFAPREVLDKAEWIDTTRQGTHAIGNLAQRIKAGRVGALVLMEGLVGHRHSDPLVHAAREAAIPFEYAGKGGRAALARALISINQKAAAQEDDS